MCEKHRFIFEWDKAYTAQLISKFEESPQHRLAEDVAPPEKGVYALYRKGQLVYAGKALQTTLSSDGWASTQGKFLQGRMSA